MERGESKQAWIERHCVVIMFVSYKNRIRVMRYWRGRAAAKEEEIKEGGK